MITDAKLTFLDNVDVSAATGTANVGDVIDLDAAGRDLFGKPNIMLAIDVGVSFASGTSSTVQFKLVSDGTATPQTDGTETVHYESEVFAHTALTAGEQIIVPLPGGIPAAERYLGLQVVTASAATTAGSISASLVVDAQNWKAYADAQN